MLLAKAPGARRSVLPRWRRPPRRSAVTARNAPWFGVLAPPPPSLGALFAPTRRPPAGVPPGSRGCRAAFAPAHAASGPLPPSTAAPCTPGERDRRRPHARGLEETRLDPAPARAAVRAALEATPTSVEALTRSARLGDLDAAGRRAVLERILLLRPHRRAALIDLANLEAREGNLDRAADLQERARAVDPDSPLLARNALVLALDRADAEAVTRAVEDVTRVGAGSSADLGSLLTRRLLAGEAGWCSALAKATGESLVLDDPVACLDAARRAREEGREVREQALLVAAHAGFAADAAAKGDTGGRSAASGRPCGRRHAGSSCWGRASRAARRLRLGLGGALAQDGDEEAARRSSRGSSPARATSCSRPLRSRRGSAARRPAERRRRAERDRGRVGERRPAEPQQNGDMTRSSRASQWAPRDEP